MVAHGHVTINGRRLDRPSYQVKATDVIRIKNRTKSLQLVQANLAMNQRPVPDFLTVEAGAMPEGIVTRLPEMEDVSIPIEPQLIIELCSK
jgi:small subunit ribosomal protein S4